MRNYKLELQLNGKHAVIAVNYLDNQSFDDCFVRYEVVWGERRSKIMVNEAYYSPPVINTPEEAIAYFEMVNNPHVLTAFSQGNEFTEEEVLGIGRAIGKFNYELKAAFYQIFK